MKINNKKQKIVQLFIIFLFTVIVCSCSKDDDNIGEDLIEQYDLVGNYNFNVTPTLMGGNVVTKGTIYGVITDEGNGVLRLRFNGFHASPMPFEMSVDVQFTVTESSSGLLVHAVEDKGYFDADPPAGGVDPDAETGFEIPDEAQEQGLHSNGKSIISGVYKNETKQLDFELDPAIGLPVIVKIQTIQKLN